MKRTVEVVINNETGLLQQKLNLLRATTKDYAKNKGRNFSYKAIVNSRSR